MDIWSAGAVLSFLLCKSPSDFEVSASLPGLTEDCVHCIKNMLVSDPGERMNAEETAKHPWLG